ncbi:selenocysteine-specific translation elongation factor [Dissulfurirhabdus thermomarina]|uniref:Selenocysteine-specific elongation factor n=1 Tax=Dissulfurirhabdus thermomarina TaxID=1765737 RepID=A0A6N9TSH3_DISTH|nr:selenocysteine-specific translation elongation factor [Dissulfurirhabdus thermomarina]NDY43043.1 selenocysteine-specific translation elongation factor [Dissulfurirhabdus thermomarina]NMX23698.1 selenocysteine-specific translation elongation factor [Dissulfurirhabdus thermomarina]
MDRTDIPRQQTVILGTAGHIDHGKTTLVRALTGIDTDRLKEEKERGITIELGFAHLTLPDGRRIGVVDVPGHERFVKNMVAGAMGVDLVALVVAADEGVMPQTREHLEITQLLGVRKGLVVLTKIDLVDRDWLELVTEDVREYLSGTFLADAPIVPVSSVTGEGLDALRARLAELVAEVEPRIPAGPYRLPVDRVFTVKGFGTVVTGTTVSGRIRVGDEAVVYPRGLETRIRGIQVHGAEAGEALAGLRTALNLQGLEKGDLARGDVVATPGSLHPTYLLDLEFHHLASAARPLKYRSPVRFHVGTAEVIGRVLFQGDELEPGTDALIQVQLEAPVAALRGDRYVIRSYSPVHTIGGGRILNPLPRRRKRTRPEHWAELERLARADAGDLIAYHLEKAGLRGLTEAELAMRTGLYGKTLHRELERLLGARRVVRHEGEGRRLLDGGLYEDLKRRATEFLARYHEANPLQAGAPKEELRSRLMPGDGGGRIFQRLLSDLARSGDVVLERDRVRLPGHQVALGKEEAAFRDRIEVLFRKAGLQPPSRAEVVGKFPGKEEAAARVFDLLVREGVLVHLREGLCIHREALEQARELVVRHLREKGELSVTDFRELTGGLSRKYMIPLLEYLDNQKVTLRVGDVRRLRSGA